MTMDLFQNTTAAPSPLTGLTVKLDRTTDRDRPCHDNLAVIGAGKGPHLGELCCASCGAHRGSISKSTGAWIESVIARFGAPPTPIIIRNRQEEALAEQI